MVVNVVAGAAQVVMVCRAMVVRCAHVIPVVNVPSINSVRLICSVYSLRLLLPGTTTTRDSRHCALNGKRKCQHPDEHGSN